ncbi:MAG: His/Gly/Thr/Pro-type tRNA ligase C-terminal domain-containing protein, partial [Candidatus Caldarchaeum sp.]
EFETRDGKRENPHQLCYGFGYSRVLAALISQHGDDRGLVLPPVVAPLHVVIVPIVFKGQEESIKQFCYGVAERLQKFAVKVDDREDVTPGEKFYHWEKLGVPVRLEIGPREVAENRATLFRRDTLEKQVVAVEEIEKAVETVLTSIGQSLAERSWRIMRQMVVEVSSIDEVKKVISERRIAKFDWCGSVECAEQLKAAAGGELRGSRFDELEVPSGPCIVCGKNAAEVVYFARAY